MENIDLDYNALYVWYSTIPTSTTVNISSGGGGLAPITTINVDTGSVTGPVITLTGGSSGLTFVASGSTITLTGSALGGGFANDFLTMGA